MLADVTRLAFARSPTSIDAMLLVTQVGLQMDNAASTRPGNPPVDGGVGEKIIDELQATASAESPKLDRTV